MGYGPKQIRSGCVFFFEAFMLGFLPRRVNISRGETGGAHVLSVWDDVRHGVRVCTFAIHETWQADETSPRMLTLLPDALHSSA